MQLSKQTVKILENFVGINSGIVIRKTPEGKKTVLRTKDREGVIYAEAEVDEVFNTNVCLYDLKAFLAVLSNFDDPEIELENDKLTVKSGKSTTHITYADPGYVIHPEQQFAPPPADFEFTLDQNDLSNILNMGNILALPHLRIFSKSGKVVAQATDAENPNTSTFDVEIGTATGDFDIYIKRSNIKMLPGDYNVKVKPGMFALFTNAVNQSLVYCTGLEIV